MHLINPQFIRNSLKYIISYLLYCIYAVFYFLQKFPDTPDVFRKFLSPHFGGRGICQKVTKSVGFQRNNKSSGNGSLTAEFYKHFYRKELSNDFRLRILRNKKILVKSQNWVKTEASVQSPFQKLFSGNINQKVHKRRFLVMPSFA